MMDEKVREFIEALNLKDFQETKPYEYLSKLKGSGFELKQAQRPLWGLWGCMTCSLVVQEKNGICSTA